MKLIRNIVCLIICFVTLLIGCAEDPKMPDNLIGASKPTLAFLGDSLNSHHITATKATVYGKIESANGTKITEKGFIWYKEGEALQSSSSAVTDGTDGVFFLTIDNLQDATNYRVLAYAKNAVGESQTTAEAFSTIAGIVRVRTLSDPVVRGNRAVVKGEITDHGEGPILEKGVKYRKTTSQTYSDPVAARSEDGNTFETEITGLEPNTDYYVRAYVKNNFGTAEGGDVKITTTDGKPLITELLMQEREETYVTFSANVTDEGDAPVTSRGFVYSQTKEGLATSDSIVFSGEGGGLFAEQITDLEPQKQYYITAFATNMYGTVGSDTLAFTLRSNAPTVVTNAISIPRSGTLDMGGRVIDAGYNATLTNSGIVYATTPNPSLANATVMESGFEDISFRVVNRRGGTTYYVRAYATNSRGETSYGEEQMTLTPPIYGVETTFPAAYVMDGTSTYLSVQEKGKGYLIGGNRGASLSRECWEFDPADNSWKNMSSPVSLHIGLKGHASVYNGTVVVTFGGIDDNQQLTNKTYAHIFTEWQEIVPNNDPPSPRYNTAASFYNNSMYVVGGIVRNGETEEVSNEVWDFQVFPANWRRNPDMPEAQYDVLSFVLEKNDRNLYAGLGLTAVGDPTSHSNRFFVYRDSEQQWTELSPMPGGNKAAGGTVIDGIIYVADEQGYLHKYNPANDSWSTITVRIPVDYRKMHCMFGFNRNPKVYIGGNQLISYDPGWDN
ncbi:kelch repeat-containing protein [Parabacteroides sp. PF5-6]|uniref:Kelch repeat-containing protein n=1 Tax=Parabacteroides sp. PF5-6 TaxID=1742403 RepID=UPI002405E85C|nr:kelch repeat-containing protein [Parabacteroides sp. PF5-6]MDF9829608.1 N-acetylneuraminic acid mutarotase [Parabacteroides sp. PF5-6]